MTTLFCAIAFGAMAQKPHYLPGDGVYILGLPADKSELFDFPVMVSEAYQATFKTSGAEMAAISTDKVYNISNRLKDDGTLDLVSFMGCGAARKLVVRNYDGESYSLGDYAPNKTWSENYLAAAYEFGGGLVEYPMGVYDHWDCPVTNDADVMLTERKAKGLTIDFGNPHEGLVCTDVNFNLVSDDADLKSKIEALTVSINLLNNDRTKVVSSEEMNVRARNLKVVGTTDDGKTIYSVYVILNNVMVIAQPFTVSIDGFDKLGVDAWVPRAVDTHNLYPTHTTYHLESGDETVAESDACVNIDGYFNYVGTWGWPDGKSEYGECVAQGDYVQVYIDPSDPDWPGMYFTGDPTFPVECTFGAMDLVLEEKPDWINTIQIDESQWEQYEALLIIMQADALPSGETGRYGKVVVSTGDEASKYTIHIRQGNGTFPTSINGVTIDVPAAGGMFDLSGRAINAPKAGQIFIKNGKKILNK